MSLKDRDVVYSWYFDIYITPFQPPQQNNNIEVIGMHISGGMGYPSNKLPQEMMACIPS